MSSIPTEVLRVLLDAIKKDHPQWDGFAQSLADIFKKERIDPRVTYARFYSAKQPLLVISYAWPYTSLIKLGEICDGRDKSGCDAFSDPLHLFKTVWIDVLCMCQFYLDETPTTSSLLVQITDRCSAAYEHLVVLDSSFLSRAWCLAELAVTTSITRVIITVVGDWSTLSAGLAEGHSFYENMKAGNQGDVPLVQAFVLSRFGSPAAFDAAVREGVVAKLRAAAIYKEAIDQYYGDADVGRPRDETKGRILFEQAAALGHAEAVYHVGECYSIGRAGLERDSAEAMRWFRRAADGGSAAGCAGLALKYKCGCEGLPKDEAAAARLYSLAVDQGDLEATQCLGEMLETGEGAVERDVGRAVELYRLGLGSEYQEECLSGLKRLRAGRGSDKVRLGLLFARHSRLDAARRSGRTHAQLVALAITGGPEWDRLSAELASAAAAEEDWEAEWRRRGFGGGGGTFRGCAGGRCALS
jgi:TPR repeat protein